MKALCLVAHPDDCVIFAYSYIWHHPELDWTIGYLTYSLPHPRAQEFADFWHRRNIPTIFLGFEDHWHDQEQKQFTRWTEESADRACWNLARDYDLVLTHDEHGDYGHIHHALVHRAVRWHPRLVTFVKPGQGTQYELPPLAYSLQELPLHSDIVASFHPSVHSNCYQEMPCT